jgi:peptide/nickel transport system substrate-binding protein
MRDPLLGNNKKLRQAISLALNRQNLLQTFYQGLGSIAHGPLPPAIWGFDPNLDSPDTHYDLKKAQELVSDLPKPLHLTYAAVANAEYRKLTEFLQQSLEPLHIVLDVQTYHWPEFLEVVQNRKAQMWIMRWQADYPDPENYLQLFYSKNATNDSGFMNASYDDFYHKMVAEADKQKRLKWVQDCVRIIVQELPWSPLVHRSSLWMRSQNLRNVQTSPFALYFRRDVYFD